MNSTREGEAFKFRFGLEIFPRETGRACGHTRQGGCLLRGRGFPSRALGSSSGGRASMDSANDINQKEKLLLLRNITLILL